MPAIAPERILKELRELWAGLASPDAGAATESGVLRACAMTFLVALDPGDDAQSVGQTIAQLIHQHPSRAIVLKPGAESAPMDARVSAQCWMPFGKRQQVCCEQIEITAPQRDSAHAGRLILGLLAPDLPTVLWCRGPAWLKSAGLGGLLPLMTKVIIDTARGCGFREIARLRARGLRVADLEWTRTTRTRQDIARFFDDPRNGGRISGLNAIVVPPGERYLAAWLLSSLPGRKIAVDGPPARIRLEGPGADFEFDIEPGGPSDYALLNEELGITGPDAVFERVLPVAETLL